LEFLAITKNTKCRSRLARERDSVSVLEQVTKSNRQAETDAILAALNSTRWNRRLAARILKIDYKPLLYKTKKLGLDDNPPSVLEHLLVEMLGGHT
jgi:transcriptional regulator with GAF, ATPase, and Fis domain